MTTYVLRRPEDVALLAERLGQRVKYPATVTVTNGAPRRSRQNRLAHVWFSDISRQLGDQTPEEVRAFCKMTLGVPVLRAENEAFRLSYDNAVKALPYQVKLEAIQHLDIPVTRMMTLKQMTAFMTEMNVYWSGRGLRLTDPEALKYEEEFIE